MGAEIIPVNSSQPLANFCKEHKANKLSLSTQFKTSNHIFSPLRWAKFVLSDILHAYAISREINFRMCRDATPGATTLGTRATHKRENFASGTNPLKWVKTLSQSIKKRF